MKKLLARLGLRRKKRSPLLRDQFPDYQIGKWSYGGLDIRYRQKEATLKIGAFCSIGRGTLVMLGGEHRTDWVTTFPFPAFWKHIAAEYPDYARKRGDVVIGNDVWIGVEATIMSGVRIGNGAIVGAKSVVTKDVPAYAVVAGNPARVIRTRFPVEIIARLEMLAWWDWDDTRIEKYLPLLLSGEVERFLIEAENASLSGSRQPETQGFA